MAASARPVLRLSARPDPPKVATEVVDTSGQACGAHERRQRGAFRVRSVTKVQKFSPPGCELLDFTAAGRR
jgi:hypothetical protein